MDDQLRDLLQEVINGSENAARTLFEKYRQYLLSLIRRRMNKKLRAQFDSVDIAQDVWASFFSEPLEKRAFQTSEQLIAFLTVLAKNKVKDYAELSMQAMKYDVNRELSMDDSHQIDKAALMGPDATPSQIAVSREEWARFLSKEPPVSKKIFLLMSEGKTNPEIAAELGINDRLIRRVMDRLKPEALVASDAASTPGADDKPIENDSSDYVPYQPALDAGISEEMDRVNFRRLQLVERKAQGELTPQEETEFANLQAEFAAYIDKLFPRSSVLDDDRLAKLEAKYKHLLNP